MKLPKCEGARQESGQASGSNDAPKKNHFCALRSRGEQETSPDVVTSMFKVLSIDVYMLLDPDATLSFVTPLVAKKFEILTDILHEPFIVSTLLGSRLLQKKVYKNCLIMLPNRVSCVDLAELDMLDFDIILGMDWLHACFASIDCRTRIVGLIFQMNPLLSGRGEILFLEAVSSLV